MKHIRPLLLIILCLTAALCGCGKQETPATQETVTETVTDAGTDASDSDGTGTTEGETLSNSEIAQSMVDMLTKNGAKNVNAQYVADKNAYRVTYSDEGLAAISYAAPDKPEVQEYWDGQVEWARSSSEVLQEYVNKLQSDADVYLELRSDVNFENALIVARNGEILYDAAKDRKDD